MMRAIWPAAVTLAMARDSSFSGTRRGTSAARLGFSNARAAPSTTTTARMPPRLSHPPTVPSASTAAAAPSTTWQITTTSRRSQRSATWPTTSVSTTVGTNCARPTRPRSSALPVRR